MRERRNRSKGVENNGISGKNDLTHQSLEEESYQGSSGFTHSLTFGDANNSRNNTGSSVSVTNIGAESDINNNNNKDGNMNTSQYANGYNRYQQYVPSSSFNGFQLQMQSNYLLNSLLPNNFAKPYPDSPMQQTTAMPNDNNIVNRTHFTQSMNPFNHNQVNKTNENGIPIDSQTNDQFNNLLLNSNSDINVQLQQLQQLQQIHQLQQLQHLQQLQQLQQHRQMEQESQTSDEPSLDPNVFELLQQQLQLQVQLDLQRQQQINEVVNQTRPSMILSNDKSINNGLNPEQQERSSQIDLNRMMINNNKPKFKIKKNQKGFDESSSQKEFKCNECEWIFVRHSDLTRHLKSHNEPEYHCPFWHREFQTCPHKNKGSFSRLDILKRHLKLVHFHLFKTETQQDSGLKRRNFNGGECLSCGKVFLTMKEFIDHVGDCALNSPMEKWRFKKNGVIVNVSKDLDNEGLTSPSSSETEEDRRSILKLRNEINEQNSLVRGSSGLKKRTGYEAKLNYLDNDEDHRSIVQNVIPALKRPRGRPKKYSN